MQKQAVPTASRNRRLSAPGMETPLRSQLRARWCGTQARNRDRRRLAEPANNDRSVEKILSGQDSGIGILPCVRRWRPPIMVPASTKFGAQQPGNLPVAQRIHRRQRHAMFATGDVLADGPSTEGGELALRPQHARRIHALGGLNFRGCDPSSANQSRREDKYTSIHMRGVRDRGTRYQLGAEEITRDLPNINEESAEEPQNERGIIYVAAESTPAHPRRQDHARSESRAVRRERAAARHLR